jgi:hypothetical protein
LRLSKFPDAWLLPLFPLLARLFYWCFCIFVTILLLCSSFIFSNLNKSSIRENQPALYSSRRCGSIDSSSHDETQRLNNTSTYNSYGANDYTATIYPLHVIKKNDHIYFARRFFLYIFIMIFRVWVLYLGLNVLEDNIIMRERDPSNIGESEMCWYRPYVSLSRQNQVCKGRDFDFSDHMVLYYSQILPISLVETLHSFRNPYWLVANRCWTKLWPMMLGMSQVYLHMITSFSAYKTVSFFHTTGEAFTGFAISSIVFVPLWWLQCSISPLAKKGRLFFFGESFST